MDDTCRHCGKSHGRSNQHNWAVCRECGQLPWLVLGDAVDCKVERLNPFGVFVQLGDGVDGLIHISQLSNQRIKHPNEVVGIGDLLQAKVIRIDYLKQKVSLSLVRGPQLCKSQTTMGTPLTDKLLNYVVKQGASGLHISVGQPPQIRYRGRLRSLPTKVLEPDDTVAIMKSVTPEHCQKELDEVDGITAFDFSFGDICRFQAFAWKDHSANVAMFFRRL